MPQENPRAILLHQDDQVATALADVAAGDRVEVQDSAGSGFSLGALADIPFGHKIAVRPIAEGEQVRKYGEVIGIAQCAIAQGAHVHVHNLKSARLGGAAAGGR